MGGMYIPKSIVFKNINRCINWGGGEGRVANRLYYGNSKIVIQLRAELCPVTNQVAFGSAHVRPNGNKLDFQNVRYQQESGVYQCVAENRHGMIVSYTVVTVRGKHLENCIYTIEPSFPYYQSGLFLCFKMNQLLLKELAIFPMYYCNIILHAMNFISF